MLALRLGRYDSNYCLKEFEKVQPQIIGNEAIWAFELDGEDFEVYLGLQDGQPDPSALSSAKEVMSLITEMDNLVQESNARECNRTGLDPKNFMLYLAYAKIENGKANLCYYGEKVNTEWDAVLVKEGGQWKPSNF